ncbi:MAG: hypothetical protein DLM54_01230 [Acidimicrobiales bacterium]|nr:MAG: hypothetical protein DLM54_01230 [Acidimicrobiales bacterium]
MKSLSTVEREQKLQALSHAIAGYEVKFGEITADEIASQPRTDRTGTVVGRGQLSDRADP